MMKQSIIHNLQLFGLIFFTIFAIIDKAISQNHQHQHNRSDYTFFRDMEKFLVKTDTRTYFGGAEATLDDFPTVCLLTDKEWNPKCSGSIISAKFILTAGHCLSRSLFYVKYFERAHTRNRGHYDVVFALFRHPAYKVVRSTISRKKLVNNITENIVTQLYNDIGLVMIFGEISLVNTMQDPMVSMRQALPKHLTDAEVKIIGFMPNMKTIHHEPVDELYGVNLYVTPCQHPTWYDCSCAISWLKENARGVCVGDSGGPVIWKDRQVGITSLGSTTCKTREDPQLGTAIVFTLLHSYLDLVNDTINDPEFSRMVTVPLGDGMPPLLKGYIFIFITVLLIIITFIS